MEGSSDGANREGMSGLHARASASSAGATGAGATGAGASSAGATGVGATGAGATHTPPRAGAGATGTGATCTGSHARAIARAGANAGLGACASADANASLPLLPNPSRTRVTRAPRPSPSNGGVLPRVDADPAPADDSQGKRSRHNRSSECTYIQMHLAKNPLAGSPRVGKPARHRVTAAGIARDRSPLAHSSPTKRVSALGRNGGAGRDGENMMLASAPELVQPFDEDAANGSRSDARASLTIPAVAGAQTGAEQTGTSPAALGGRHWLLPHKERAERVARRRELLRAAAVTTAVAKGAVRRGVSGALSEDAVASPAPPAPSMPALPRVRLEAQSQPTSESLDSGGALLAKPVSKIAGYLFSRLIGRGSFGHVRLATHNLSGCRVAIKITPKSALSSARLRHRAEMEWRLQAWLDHPNIAKVVHVAEDNAHHFIVQEYVQGGSLAHYLEMRHGHVPETDAASILKQAAAALVYCHAHDVFHRDVKLDNVLLDYWGRCKLTDFGLAVRSRGAKLTMPCGSLLYNSPEIIRGVPYDGGAADVWAFGVMAFALTTGVFPFEASNLQLLRQRVGRGRFMLNEKSVSVELASMLKAALVVEPSERPTMSQLLSHAWFLKFADPALKIAGVAGRSTLEVPSAIFAPAVSKLVETGEVTAEAVEAAVTGTVDDPYLSAGHLLMRWRIEHDAEWGPLDQDGSTPEAEGDESQARSDDEAPRGESRSRAEARRGS
mmetsp:Transcript_15178/g.36069  ORF Transcript_15178/g.36069 Transcript_15178/m.36069 type:complete len:727 (-) Transcript_15178:101-2281(-)